MTDELLAMSIAAAVPLRIREIADAGGPTDIDYERVHGYDLSMIFAEYLIVGGGKPGQVAHQFNAVVDCIAVLAFCPGGIHIFGSHFVGQREEQTV